MDSTANDKALQRTIKNLKTVREKKIKALQRDYLSPPQISEASGRHVRTVRMWLKNGRLKPVINVGTEKHKVMMVHKSVVRKFILSLPPPRRKAVRKAVV